MFDLRSYKKTLPALLFIAGIISFIAASAEAAVDLVNELTANHTKTPGTNIYFIPANDLAPSERFNGFISDERAIEVIVASIKSPYSEISGVFTDANLLTRGVEVGSRGDITVNGSKGLLLKALHKDGDKRWGKWIMILEDGDDTLVVNGIFTSGDSDAARDVEAMLKSVIVEQTETPEAMVVTPGGGVSALDINLSGMSARFASGDLVKSSDEEGVIVDDENNDEDID
ncbi:MAG: hypothetical protein LBT31_06715 [Synergistaceae bacterium]|jgi:hypothetical protein|nr:hypothetical protein [Synergistaceae bacterium]